MERVLTSSQRKISPMPTGPKGEKRPADVLGKRRFKPLHCGSFLTLLRIPDRRSLRIGSETTQDILFSDGWWPRGPRARQGLRAGPGGDRIEARRQPIL